MGIPKHKRRSDVAGNSNEDPKSKKRRLAPKKVAKAHQDKVEPNENCGGTQNSQVSESSVLTTQTSQLEVAVGNVHDNLDVLFEVKLKLQKGDVKGAFDMLQVVDRQIQASPDPKNQFLEPYVQKQFAKIAEAEALKRLSWRNVLLMLLVEATAKRPAVTMGLRELATEFITSNTICSRPAYK